MTSYSMQSSISIVKYEGVLEEDAPHRDLTIGDAMSYTVIKNQPFIFFAEAPGKIGFFQTSHIRVSLNYYDLNTSSVSPRQVSYVNNFPIEYKTRVNPDGTELEVESSLCALTSQHGNALFCIVLEIGDPFGNWSSVSTVPLKVVSKTDSLSMTMPTASGQRKTITELLDVSLNKLELDEVKSTRMISSLCTSRGLIEESVIEHHNNSNDLGEVVKRLCNEYRTIMRSQRSHRLLCEVAGLDDNDALLLSRVNEAFCESFQRVFDANYANMLSGR